MPKLTCINAISTEIKLTYMLKINCLEKQNYRMKIWNYRLFIKIKLINFKDILAKWLTIEILVYTEYVKFKFTFIKLLIKIQYF